MMAKTKRARKPNPRKLELIALSKTAKAMREIGSDDLMKIPEGMPDTVNNIIIYCFYPKGVYNTFNGWKEQGFKVIKGQKGFAIWGKKRKFEKQVEGKSGDSETKEYDAFPVAYLFHEKQVEVMEVKR